MRRGIDLGGDPVRPPPPLDNLVAIVDSDKIQSLGPVREVLDLEPLADKWLAFNWAVREVAGHDHEQLLEALAAVPWEPGRPSAPIAHTTKGKGVSSMEERLAWHYKSPDAEQLARALAEGECHCRTSLNRYWLEQLLPPPSHSSGIEVARG
jgi:transketolase